jgi:hypothetical protein
LWTETAKEKQKKYCHSHGYSKTAIYSRWKNMLSRCEDPNHINFNDYGGRGIKVCERWHNFENFLADMGNPFTDNKSKALQIDRINNNGNYEPGNCRWVTPRENCNNRRNNVLITWNNRTLTLVQWSRETGIPRDTLSHRIKSSRLSIEEILTVPVGAHPWRRSRHP